MNRVMNLFKFSILFLLAACASLSWADISCKATCPGSKFIVDMQARCMCLSTGYCFKIDIGKDGPNMTTGGIGKLHEAKGAKYQTKPGFGTTSYDNDAIATGIQGNDAVGRWIHKTRGPEATGAQTTKGCIAVPWNVWPLVKQELTRAPQTISICGTTNRGGGGHMEGHMSGESDDSGSTR